MFLRFFIKGLFLFSALSIVLPSYVVAATPRQQVSSQGKIKIGSEPWIELKLRQFPELLWLTESSGNPLSQTIFFKDSYSHSLFNKKVSAFDVTMRSLIYLHLIAQGSRQSYTQLIQMLPSEGRMTFKQYQTIHKQLESFLKAPKQFDNTFKILETAIVLRHLGCSAKAVTIFKPYFTDCCSRTFYTKALHVLQTFPELCPSFARLTPEQKNVFHSLRFLGSYESLFKLTDAPSPQLLSIGKTHRSLVVLDLYLYCLDVCGDGSYSQDFYYSFSHLLSMLQQHATVEEAFSRHLTYRANRLGFEGTSRTEMTLVRLATLMNLSPTETTTLSWSFRNLSVEESETLVNSFYTIQGELIPRSFYGLPSLISGLFSANHNATTSPENRSQQVYSTFLSLLTKSLKEQKEMLHKHLLPENTVLDFSSTASSCGGLDVFSENISVRIHLNGAVSVTI
ncbi:hypothetical protein [Chlamydia sp. 17-3921]|uniref:hypothetical protein n=1 Tax=Chlamydia sp. 17-3921 TaxID=2675798 RepID=UPI001F2ECA34|nr:hypothetical protein [Chlamydia sp. 17-3921]